MISLLNNRLREFIFTAGYLTLFSLAADYLTNNLSHIKTRIFPDCEPDVNHKLV